MKIPALVLLCVAFVTSCTFSRAETADENRVSEPLKVFRQAMSSPPDIKYFVAGLRPLGEMPIIRGRIISGSFQYSVGARSGIDFYCYQIGTNSSATRTFGPVYGRSGEHKYCVSGSSIMYARTGSASAKFNDSSFHLISQFLNMGVGDLQPESLKWTDETHFTATSTSGAARFGRLSVSNALPHRLTIFEEPDGKPLKEVEYFYPSPPHALQGFPCRMIHYDSTQAGFEPVSETVIEKLELADRPLTDAFFDPKQFRNAADVAIDINAVERLFPPVPKTVR